MFSSSKNRIIDFQNEIHRNLSNVYINKVQCEQLSQRIDQIIDSIERLEHATSAILRQENSNVLENFLQCIDECNEFIEKLTCSDRCIEELYDYKTCEEKFEEFNQRLSQLSQDLTLGLNIQQLFDTKQNEDDRKEDLKQLNNRLDAVAQQLLEKQVEQCKMINTLIEKRLESFSLNLAQNLLLRQNVDESKQIDNDHQQFLHIPHKDLHIEDKAIGNGGFSDVYKGMWLTHRDQVAVKVIRLNSVSNIRNEFYEEISTMYRIRYEHILNVLGGCIEPNFYAIVVEYMPLGSLYDILHNTKGQHIEFSWFDRYSIAKQMAKSINYLHNLNPTILHRDIKSMNFLLKYSGAENEKYLVKVCDFGLAEIRRETLSQSASFPSYHVVGSFYWKAPELLLRHGRHTKHSDVYSLGMVFWELATEKTPWSEYDDETVILVQVRTGERPTIPTNVPEQYKKLIEVSWDHVPENRPTCFQLIERIEEEIDQMDTKNNTNVPIDLHPSCVEIEKYDSIGSQTEVEYVL